VQSATAARVLATLFGSAPGRSVDSPVTWVMLAAARRQIGASGTATVAPTVTAAANAVANQPPVIANIVLSGPSSSTGAVTGTVSASDPDADKLTFKATASTKGAVAVMTTGVFTYTPTATARHAAAKLGAPTSVTTDAVTVTVTDAKGAAVSRAVTVPISGRNSVPTATKTVGGPSATRGVVTGQVTGTDADRDPLAYTATTPAKGTVSVTATTGVFNYTPTAAARHAAARIGASAADKADGFTVTVADGYGGSVAVPVTVAVSPANSAPTATAAVAKPDPVTGVAKGTVTAADADKDSLTFTASKPGNGAVTVGADGSFAYSPTAAARSAARTSTTAKTDTFTITVSDGYGGAKAVSVTATIAPADAAPVAGTPTSTANAGTGVVTGNVNAVDPDKDPLTYTAAGATTAKGSVSLTASGAFTYTPTATARHAAARTTAVATDKADTFTVTVTDKYGAVAVIPVTVTVSPANAAPVAGATVVGIPAPATGEVTGTVRATDADKDPLTYSAPTTSAKGSITVTAAGAFTYTPSIGATGGTDVFTVTVADGYGGTVAVPVTVPVSLPGQLSTFCGCTLMPANTVFHADVSALPVLAKSATWTTLLGGTLFAAWGGAPWMGNTAGMPVNTVSATRAGETVIFNRGYSTTGPSIDNTPYAIPDYPLVEGMPSAPAWDRHLLVFQEGTCISQELYNVANGVELPANGFGDALANGIYAGTYGSAWIAEAGGHVDMHSPLYPVSGWANASELPYLPLILRPDDLTRGSIDHMLGITIAKDRGTGYAWPARAGDGTGTNPDGVPMGTVFRLRADFDITTYDPATQVVLRALQQHGAVVYDSGNPGQNGASLMAMSNGWTGTGYLTAQQQLRTIPLSAFEAVDVLSLAVDPTTGWTIRSAV
jgi:VCBS repeat-containing protein